MGCLASWMACDLPEGSSGAHRLAEAGRRRQQRDLPAGLKPLLEAPDEMRPRYPFGRDGGWAELGGEEVGVHDGRNPETAPG